MPEHIINIIMGFYYIVYLVAREKNAGRILKENPNETTFQTGLWVYHPIFYHRLLKYLFE